MSDRIKWLHLSDFHFGKNEFEQIFSSRKLIEHLALEKDRGNNPDFIFITGDIADAGRVTEFKLFCDHIVTPIVGLYGSSFLDRIYIVPGNHDLDRKVNDAFSKEKFARTDADHFLPTDASNSKRQMLIERFDAFIQNLPTFGLLDFAFESGTFARIQTIENARTVGISGINTAWLCDGDRDKESLTPGLQITRAALEKIATADVKFVLGHHPLDWLHLAHVPVIQSLFAEHNVIYLHGHMHSEGFSSASIGAGEFSAIQAGAAWQAPEGGKWKNGFMWGQFDFISEIIKLQPYHWSFENQCWVLDGSRFHERARASDWWQFDAPRAKRKLDYSPKKKGEPLVGWDIKDFRALERCTENLRPEDAIAYFDGATPTWAIALSDSVPRREIVAKIVSSYQSTTSLPLVCVLVAAGCEGKTTAMLQSCLEILRQDQNKKVIYRTNHTRPFVPSELRETLNSHSNWLIVIDEADQVASEILHFIDAGFDGFGGRIDFLLASRDSDWRASGASNLSWSFRAKFREIILKDLSSRDADLIVRSWAEYGARGLGDELVRLPADERADKLKYYAKKEAKGTSDAFFGALLMSRHGNDLLEHAESMLHKLHSVELPNGKTLKDALGYIAAMHAEGFNKLDFAALAGIMEMSIPKLQNEVIRQLGKEAAATSTATTIFTRHKYIATALIEVLENSFNEDVSQYYIELALSETRRHKTERVMDLPFWRFGMAEQLFSSGKTRLAIDIAEKLLQADESNSYLLTKLAYFYRKQGGALQAVELFRAFGHPPLNRGFFFEWGVCEGTQRNYLENALLAAFALSDESEASSLTIDGAKMFLTGLSKCCDQLHISFADPIFRDADGASNSILKILGTHLGSTSRENSDNLEEFMRDVAKRRRKMFGRAEAIKIIKDMTLKLETYGVALEVANAVDIKSATFASLDRIVKNMESLN